MTRRRFPGLILIPIYTIVALTVFLNYLPIKDISFPNLGILQWSGIIMALIGIIGLVGFMVSMGLSKRRRIQQQRAQDYINEIDRTPIIPPQYNSLPDSFDRIRERLNELSEDLGEETPEEMEEEMEEDTDEVYKNQIGLLNVDLYDYLHIAVIGAGSIGSYLSFGLNKLGFTKQLIIDNDKVEKHNIPTQLYGKTTIGRSKSAALKAILSSFGYSKSYVSSYDYKVGNNDIIQADVVFVCTDSIKSRQEILRSIILSASSKTGRKPKLLIDGRMHGLVYRVFTVNLNDVDDIKHYVKSLEGKPVEGVCTEKGIIHNIFGVVSTMIEQYRKALTGEDYAQEINADIRNGTIFKVGMKKWKIQSKPQKS